MDVTLLFSILDFAVSSYHKSKIFYRNDKFQIASGNLFSKFDYDKN